jgi:hypothetical protein
MRKPYSPYIPQGKSEVMDQLAAMLLSKPTFVDDSGYFPDRTIDTEFFALNEGLRLIRRRLGEERYQKLAEMSEKMRACFDADSDEDSDEVQQGRMIILDMRELLIRKG